MHLKRTPKRCYTLLKISLTCVLILTISFFLYGIHIVFTDSNMKGLDNEPINSESDFYANKQNDMPRDVKPNELKRDNREEDHMSLQQKDNEPMGNPIVLWWTPFTGEIGSNRECSLGTCYFTQDRLFKDSIEKNPSKAVAYVFYGTDFTPWDLPLPRYSNEYWALLHEESPKNNFLFCYQDVMELFNFTSTFKSSSDFPLTLQYIENLEMITSLKYFQLTEKKSLLQASSSLAPVMYVQSSCEAPSDRDSYVNKLMEFVAVDSYGSCLHNKDLAANIVDPIDGMQHHDFLALSGQYKFVLAMENAVSDEYMTEKLWRNIHVGAVPIYYGSSKQKTSSWLPNGASSAIFVTDFPDPKDLATFLKKLNQDDSLYEAFLEHKTAQKISNKRLKDTILGRAWGVGDDNVISKGSFIAHFECFLCDQLHKQKSRKSQVADSQHYDCPEPVAMVPTSQNDSLDERPQAEMWKDQHLMAKYEAKALRELIASKQQFGQDVLMDRAIDLYSHFEGHGDKDHDV